jgi:hypothetical protein
MHLQIAESPLVFAVQQASLATPAICAGEFRDLV